jgi:hypothetical protein
MDCGGELDLYAHCYRNRLTHHAAVDGNHAIHADDAYERATIVLRLLLGEREWSDGFERKLDDCFEMNDGNAVCGWLIEFAEHDERIRALLNTHRNLRITDHTLALTAGGSTILNHWNVKGWRNAHRVGELALT